MSRRHHLYVESLIQGFPAYLAAEAVATTLLAYPPGWGDVLVHADGSTVEETP
jgi:hypothetical protein